MPFGIDHVYCITSSNSAIWESVLESDHIKCPQCGTEIEVGEVLAAQVTVAVEARVRHEAEAKLKQAVAAA